MSPWNGQLFPMSSLAFMALPIIFFLTVKWNLWWKNSMWPYLASGLRHWTLSAIRWIPQAPWYIKAIPPNHGSQGLATTTALSCPFQDLRYFRSHLPCWSARVWAPDNGSESEPARGSSGYWFPWSFFWQQECSCLTQALPLHCTPIYLVLGIQTWPKLSLFWLKD